MTLAERTASLRSVYRSSKPGDDLTVQEKEGAIIARALAATRERLGAFNVPNQVLGQRDTIGCVALEITQRCNLDCTLCYLSENSESVRDTPLQEIFRRIDAIYEAYGPNTGVQVTGGEPTLRPRKELVEIVRRCRELGLPPALMTNGIKVTRDLLLELAEAGLNDVAFHVDLSQERKGYATEADLNAVRQEYIEMARDIPIKVMFNTTIFGDNFSEIPDLVRFFIKNADVVELASFQIQADTGRGEVRGRPGPISMTSVTEMINAGARNKLGWGNVVIGHPECNNWAPSFVVNGRMFPLIYDKTLFGDFLRDFSHVVHDRRESKTKTALRYVKEAFKRKEWALRSLSYGGHVLASMLPDLVLGKGKVHKLSFFVHNFMDAKGLVPERVEACSFMVMTADGPVSMCQHNAERDTYILKPIEIDTGDGKEMWDPIGKALRAPPASPAPARTMMMHATSAQASGAKAGCGSGGCATGGCGASTTKETTSASASVSTSASSPNSKVQAKAKARVKDVEPGT